MGWQALGFGPEASKAHRWLNSRLACTEHDITTWWLWRNTAALHGRRRRSGHTWWESCMLFSCIYMMASDILTSIVCMTDSMLNGPSSLSVKSNMASVKTQHGRVKKRVTQRERDLVPCLVIWFIACGWISWKQFYANLRNDFVYKIFFYIFWHFALLILPVHSWVLFKAQLGLKCFS